MNVSLHNILLTHCNDEVCENVLTPFRATVSPAPLEFVDVRSEQFTCSSVYTLDLLFRVRPQTFDTLRVALVIQWMDEVLLVVDRFVMVHSSVQR